MVQRALSTTCRHFGARFIKICFMTIYNRQTQERIPFQDESEPLFLKT